jgi:hypothetical protein
LPKKTQYGPPAKTTLHLITNNFKIKSKNKGVIYTYKVDFIEKQGPGGGAQGGFEGSREGHSMSEQEYVGKGDQLQTFQKFRIMKAHQTQLKQIFDLYVFVGNNLFSTVPLDSQVSLETAKPIYQRQYVIIMERVS